MKASTSFEDTGKIKGVILNSKLPAIEGGKAVRGDFLIFGAPKIGEDEIREVVDTLRSGWIGTGPKTHLFEKLFREYIGCRNAIAVNSCTAGLHLGLDVLGVTQGDEVITSPMTFPSTANVILHHRAVPLFVDVELDTMNIDPAKIEQKITRRTKVVLPVHFAGRPCRMDEIMSVARRYNLFVVEDAAHAIESSIDSQKVGRIGDITSFSFYVTKNVVTAEGGMVTTDNDDWGEEMRIRSLHGISRDAWKRYSSEGFQLYDTVFPGYKYNMTDITASLGIHQIRQIEDNLKIREKLWRRYNEAFRELEEIITPKEEENIKHARHLYTVLLNLKMLKIDRNQFAASLKAEGIGIGIHFIAVHLHTLYQKTFGFSRGDFPNAEYISDRTLSLPLSPKLTEHDIDDVIEAVYKLLRYYHR